jgi:hypothetical protein
MGGMKALVLAASAVAGLLVVHGVGASDNYQDRSGDGHGAADIQSLYLQDNWTGKKGLMYFQISVNGSSGMLTLDIDSDKKATTGSPGGGDYRVEMSIGRETDRFLKWNGSRFVPVRTPLVDVHWRGEPDIEIQRRAIGNPSSFRFSLHSSRGAAADRAPNKGYWLHEVPT